MKSAGKKVDAHQHFWHYRRHEFEWIDQDSIRRDFLPKDLLGTLDSAAVVGTVLVQARELVEETKWNLRLASETPFVLGVVGWIDWTRRGGLAEVTQLPHANWLKGVRLLVQGRDPSLMSDPVVRANLKSLADENLACDLLITREQVGAAIELVRAFPQQRFVVDHCAKPKIRAGAFDAQWAQDMKRLAALPNVLCKVSGLVTEVHGELDAGVLREYWQFVLECFGSERLMFGSDWPVCLGRIGYAEWASLVEAWVSELSPDERVRVLHENAVRFYNLEADLWN